MMDRMVSVSLNEATTGRFSHISFSTQLPLSEFLHTDILLKWVYLKYRILHTFRIMFLLSGIVC